MNKDEIIFSQKKELEVFLRYNNIDSNLIEKILKWYSKSVEELLTNPV